MPGKRAFADPPIKCTISLPESLMLEVDLRLYDPVRRKVGYGERSKLIANLLRQWVKEQQVHDKRARAHLEARDTRDLVGRHHDARVSALGDRAPRSRRNDT